MNELLNPVKRLDRTVVTRITKQECDSQKGEKISYSEIPDVVPNPVNEKKFIFDGYVPKKDLINFIINQRKIEIPENVEYISDFMLKQIPFWHRIQGMTIALCTGTGTGKTTFIRELAKFTGEKILLLTNRVTNRKQVEHYVNCEGGLNNLDIMNYQSLKTISGSISLLNRYSFLVADEAHYYLSDSSFNPDTNIHFQSIMNATFPIKIFMTATSERIVPQILEKMLRDAKWNQMLVMQKFLQYECINRKSNIRKIVAFSQLASLYFEIENSDFQWMVYVKNVAQGNEIKKDLLKRGITVDFLCRESIDDEMSEEEKNILNNLIKTKSFSSKVLVTTILLDNGVDVVMPSLKAMAILLWDSVELVQIIGRKRCHSSNDWFDIYLYEEDYRTLKATICNRMGKKNQLNQTEKMLNSGVFDPRWIKPGKEYDVERYKVFWNDIQSRIKFNHLYKIETTDEINELYKYLEYDHPIDYKVEIIRKKFACVPQVVYAKEQDAKVFLLDLVPFSNCYFLRKDKEKILDFRKVFTRNKIKFFGKDSVHERSGRPYSMKKIKQVCSELNLPINITEDPKGYLINIEKR